MTQIRPIRLEFKADSQALAGPHKPRAADALRERVEADIDRVPAPLSEALTVTRSVVAGSGPSTHLETVDDVPTRVVAVRDLLDHAYGHAPQPVTAVSSSASSASIRRIASLTAADVITR